MKGVRHSSRPRSRTATLNVTSGDAYSISSRAAGKVDAADDGLHVQHGVPQSPDPQLTLGVDVTLRPDQATHQPSLEPNPNPCTTVTHHPHP